MAIPFFYIPELNKERQLTLDEETSRHAVQVLRMTEGEQLNLTDGKGHLLTCSITEANKKRCRVEIKSTRYKEQDTRRISVAISLLKNTNRFEWFLEKATELGVSEIIPLVCERTEREKFRFDRMNAICISAMLQSQQCWLPVLREPAPFNDAIMIPADRKFIAHCEEGNKQELDSFTAGQSPGSTEHQLICIGPEGDFTPAEIQAALDHGFVPVSLGATRLRTETAGVVAAVLLNR